MAYKRAERQGFVVLHRARVQLQFLTDEECGKLFRALLDFSESGTKPEFEGCLAMAFATLADQVEVNREKWEKRCSRNAQNRQCAAAHSTTVDDCQSSSPSSVVVDKRGEIEEEGEEEGEDNIPPMSPKGECTQLDDEFGRFWEAYPRKRGKQNAQKAFEKALGVVDLAAMLTALEAQKQTAAWTRDAGRYIPYPATWLNGHRWEDVLDEPATPAYQPLQENIPTPTWL